jgi:hypothetical protein
VTFAIFCSKMSFVFFRLSGGGATREIICTEDRKDHEEEMTGAWSTLFRSVAAQVDRVAFKEGDSL